MPWFNGRRTLVGGRARGTGPSIEIRSDTDSRSPRYCHRCQFSNGTNGEAQGAPGKRRVAGTRRGSGERRGAREARDRGERQGATGTAGEGQRRREGAETRGKLRDVGKRGAGSRLQARERAGQALGLGPDPLAQGRDGGHVEVSQAERLRHLVHARVALGAGGERLARDQRQRQRAETRGQRAVVGRHGPGGLRGEPPGRQHPGGGGGVVDAPQLLLEGQAVGVGGFSGASTGSGPRLRCSNAAPMSWSRPRLKPSGPRMESRGEPTNTPPRRMRRGSRSRPAASRCHR